MPVISLHVSTVTKVPYPKKKRDNWDEPTHRTKEKHQIEKMPSNPTINDLIKIRHKYHILSCVGMMSVPHHLYDANDPPSGWWVVHLAPFKIGLWYINLAKVNPNEWRTLLCLSIVVG